MCVRYIDNSMKSCNLALKKNKELDAVSCYGTKNLLVLKLRSDAIL